MFRPLSAFGQSLLLTALLTTPGLGTADFCLAKGRACNGAEVDPCCCEQGSRDQEKAPCCVTLHRDWMVPVKEAAKAPVPHLPDPLPAWISEPVVPAAVATRVWKGRASLDPPPPARGVSLALIQVRLV